VHLGVAGIPVAEARRFAGPRLSLGASTHNLPELRAAQEGGADYATFGPVFATASKAAYGPPVGVEALREAVRASTIPVLALGGITADSARALGGGRHRGRGGDRRAAGDADFPAGVSAIARALEDRVSAVRRVRERASRPRAAAGAPSRAARAHDRRMGSLRRRGPRGGPPGVGGRGRAPRSGVLGGLTAQSSLGVQAVSAVPRGWVQAQLAALASENVFGAVKTGTDRVGGVHPRGRRLVRARGIRTARRRSRDDLGRRASSCSVRRRGARSSSGSARWRRS
jgi:thiamine monophosphate synthase